MQYEILRGDCIAAMRAMADNSVDSIVTDPPYELGFMGKSWDASGIAYSVEMWREALRVLKPGGHLLAFSGSRTYHRMACAIEDAGFEVRDQIMWVYGSGFPKSLDVAKALEAQITKGRSDSQATGDGRSRVPGQHYKEFRRASGPKAEFNPTTDAARQWDGWGTALKPAHEPICVARKPLVGTVAANVLAHGTGALNIDWCRVGSEGGSRWVSKGDAGQFGGGIKDGAVEVVDGLGRWPANLIHDGSDEVTGLFPGDADASAARFFYCAKASKNDRGPNNTHPTVKPLALMQYLCRLVTPPGGHVLDQFAGSGSTLVAALREGFTVTGIELLDDHATIIEGRVENELYGDIL
jgi:DNA modification methylase